jgi:thiosulfate reductase cytochrome b subunit
MSKQVLIYNRFNRFWHWSQALLIILLGVTGFEIHGTFSLVGFERAVTLHNWMAGAFGVLVAFAIFWHLTTDQWRHYTPTRKHLREMTHFYLRGIFRGEHHPFKKTEIAKLNPLQRLTYLSLKLLIFPIQGLTGLAYFYYDDLAARGYLPDGVGTIALIHTAGAFALLAFLIAHIYLTTTGETLTSNLKAMVTGWEELPAQATARQSPETPSNPSASRPAACEL